MPMQGRKRAARLHLCAATPSFFLQTGSFLGLSLKDMNVTGWCTFIDSANQTSFMRKKMSSLAARFCLTSLAGRLPRPAGMGAARVITQSSSGAPLKAGSAGVGCAGQLSSRMKTISGHHTAFPRSAAMRSFPSLSHMGRVGAGARGLCMPAEEYNKRIQDVNDQFAEARLLIEDALDSNGTTYFEEDLADAQEAVAECLKLYNETLDALDDKRKGETQRSMGMKMEQLKGELAQIVDALTHDEELPPSRGS